MAHVCNGLTSAHPSLKDFFLNVIQEMPDKFFLFQKKEQS